MYVKTLVIILMAVTVWSMPHLFLVATQAQSMAAPHDDEATHEALRTLKKAVEASFNKAGKSGKLEDFQGVLDYAHENVVLVAMNGDTVVGKKGIVEYFNKMMVASSRTVRSIHHVFDVAALTTLYGGDTGVAYGTSVGTYELLDGMNFTVNTKWTATMVKEEGKWLLASFQFGPNIFDNPVLNSAVRALYWGAGGAAVIGLLLGFLLGRFTARKARAV